MKKNYSLYINVNLKKSYELEDAASYVCSAAQRCVVDHTHGLEFPFIESGGQCMSKILFQHESLCVLSSVRSCVRRLAPIPADDSQNVTNKMP